MALAFQERKVVTKTRSDSPTTPYRGKSNSVGDCFSPESVLFPLRQAISSMLPTQYGGTQAYCLQRCILTDGDYIFPKLAQSKRDERDEGRETAHNEHEALRRGITLSRDIK